MHVVEYNFVNVCADEQQTVDKALPKYKISNSLAYLASAAPKIQHHS